MPVPIIQEMDTFPCHACQTKRSEPKGVWCIITCTGGCNRPFHFRNDCANPRPTIDQRKGVKQWKCQECLNNK